MEKMVIFIISIFAFLLPIFTRKHFKFTQGGIAIIWLILTISITPYTPPTNYELLLKAINFFILPIWVFGSLISLYLLMKEDVKTN